MEKVEASSLIFIFCNRDLMSLSNGATRAYSLPSLCGIVADDTQTAGFEGNSESASSGLDNTSKLDSSSLALMPPSLHLPRIVRNPCNSTPLAVFGGSKLKCLLISSGALGHGNRCNRDCGVFSCLGFQIGFK